MAILRPADDSILYSQPAKKMKKVERRFFLKSSAAVSAFVMVNPGFGMRSGAPAGGDYSSDDSAEIALNRKWAEDSFSHHLPFSFVYGGKNSA